MNQPNHDSSEVVYKRWCPIDYDGTVDPGLSVAISRVAFGWNEDDPQWESVRVWLHMLGCGFDESEEITQSLARAFIAKGQKRLLEMMGGKFDMDSLTIYEWEFIAEVIEEGSHHAPQAP